MKTASPPRHRFIETLERLGYGIPEKARVLELGCGSGVHVREFCDLGYDAYGCDFHDKFKNQKFIPALTSEGRFRLIEREPYRLPFEDGQFDLVVSRQVLEHVQNFDETMKEIGRVMKPGGINLHTYPPRTKFLEGHVFVPFGGVIQERWWYALWIFLGFRKKIQRGMSFAEVLDYNFNYVRTNTNYLSDKALRAYIKKYFNRAIHCEPEFFMASPSPIARLTGHLMHKVPFLRGIWRFFRLNVIVFVNDTKKDVSNVSDVMAENRKQRVG